MQRDAWLNLAFDMAHSTCRLRASAVMPGTVGVALAQSPTFPHAHIHWEPGALFVAYYRNGDVFSNSWYFWGAGFEFCA